MLVDALQKKLWSKYCREIFIFPRKKKQCRKSRVSIISHPIHLTIFSHVLTHEGKIIPLWTAEILQSME